MPTVLGTSKQYSAFSPVNIPGCALWLDAADSSTITASSGSVSQWKDKSGNGNNGTATGSPTLSGGGILFNGSSQYITGPVSVTGSNLTVFTVANTVAGGSTFTAGRIVSGAATGTNDFDNTPSMDILVYNPFSSLTLMSFRNYVALSSVTTPTNARFLAVSQTNATTNTVYLNGTAGTATSLTGAAVGAFNMGQYSVATGLGTSGSIAYYNGYVYEVLFYSADLTTVQRQQVEQYLINKWLGGLPGTASTFTYTGAAQTYSVPPRVTALNVYMWGAGGGGAYTSGGTGGAGAFVTGSLAVSPEQTLTLVVGGGGTQIPYTNGNFTAGAYGGGGGSGRYGQGGGGRSAIQFTAGTDAVTAGGGGGGGDQNNSSGAPGGSATFSGTANSGSGSQGGGGASQTAGGAVGGGNKTGSGSSAPTAGSQYLGGQCDDSAGSGGGGYYGGGGSANGGYNACGGGGGSSYTANLSLISGSAALGSNSTNGVSAPATSSPYYASGVAAGGTSGTSTVSARVGGNGLIVIVPVTTYLPLYTRPFQPSDIGGCCLWLDGADGSTVTGTTTMTAWRDKSGNGYTATSFSNSVAAPSWVTNAPLVGNAVQYSAGNGSVITNFVLAQTMSIFEVCYSINQSSYGTFIEHGVNENTNPGFYFYMGGGNNFAINTGSGQVPVNYGNVTVSNVWQMTTGINPDPANSSTMAYYVNGALVASGATQSGTTPITANLYINGRGGANSISSNSYLGELIIYDTALTASQRQQVEGYLAQKWGLTGYLTGIPSPTAISGCRLWFDGADSSSITTSGGYITQWRDKSGNGTHLGVSTGGQNALISDSSYTSNTVVSFPNGSVLVTGSAISYSADQTTVFVVARFISFPSAGIGMVFAFPDESGNGDYSIRYYNNTLNSSDGNDIGNGGRYYVNGTNSVPSSSSTYTNYHMISSAFALTRNGSSRVSLSSTFASRYFIGNIAEVIVFSSALTSFQRQQIEGYLANKWGLRPLLPSTQPYYIPHPFRSIPPYLSWVHTPAIANGLTYNFDATMTPTTLPTLVDNKFTNNITLTNNPTVVNGTPGYITFNGTSGYGSYFLLNQGSFTVTAWIRTSTTADNATFYQKPHIWGVGCPSAPDRDLGVTIGAGYAGAWSGMGPSVDQANQTAPTSALVNDGLWHEVTMASSFNTGTRVFVDTVQTGMVMTQGQFPTGNPIYLGGQNAVTTSAQSGYFGTAGGYGASTFGNFDISVLNVYSRCLQSNELINNFNAFASRFSKTQVSLTLYGASSFNPDPYAQFLVLAAPLNATWGFNDVSAYIRQYGTNLTPTAVNSAALTSSASKFYTQSLDVSPYTSKKYIAFAGTSNLNNTIAVGGSDFTVEFWFYLTANNVGYQCLLTHSGDASGTYSKDQSSGWIIILETNNYLYAYASSGSGWPVAMTNGSVPSTNTWHHCALERYGNTFALFLDGSQVATSTNNYTVIRTPLTQNLRIGDYQWLPPNDGSGERSASAYIQDVRIYVGVAKYKGSYTVPGAISPS